MMTCEMVKIAVEAFRRAVDLAARADMVAANDLSPRAYARAAEAESAARDAEARLLAMLLVEETA